MKFSEKYQDAASICFADKRAILVLKDRKERREYRGNNPDQLFLTAYRVDGGLMKGEGMKCDYAVYTETDNLYFIELKGGDYSHALDQLLNTIQLLMQPDIECPQSIHTRVVLSKLKVPGAWDSKEKKLMALLKRKYNGTHRRETQVIVENIL